MRTNSFTRSMSKKSDAELEQIIQEKSKYTNEALQAVIWELENRNLIEKEEIVLEVAKEDKVLVSDKVDEKKENAFEEFELPVLYSKKAIQGFTIFFTTIFGAVLLMKNLKEMNKPKARMLVLFFGISYTLFSVILLNYLPKTFLITLIFNLFGYGILIEFFWNKNLGKDLKYTKKQIWKPLIISILITFVFVFLQFLPQILGI